MAKLSIKAGSTSQSIYVWIQDSSSTVGAGLAGLVFNTASLTAYYALSRAAAVQITLATQTVTGAFSSGGFVAVDGTNMPGLYRLDIPDAAIASGRSVVVMLKGATNMAPCVLEIELTATDNQDGVRMGMTALPNAAAAASGGLIINGSNTGTVTLAALTVSGATTLTGNVSMAAGLTITQSTTNGAGLDITGNGAGAGVAIKGSSTGIAMTISSTASHALSILAGTNSDALRLAGNGTGHAVDVIAGATGNGIKVVGGSTSGDAVNITATSGNAITATGGTNGSGIAATGAGTGAGVNATAGATGNGIKVVGGSTSGAGIAVTATSGDGIATTGGGTGHGVNTTGGATNGHGFNSQGTGTGDGINAVGGTGTGACGICAAAGTGTVSFGLKIVGGGTSGAGINITTTSGDGINIAPTAGNGVTIAANGAGARHGISVTAAGSGHGIISTGSTGGDGINATGGGSGAGFHATGGSSGDGITAAGGGGGSGFTITAGATGIGMNITASGTNAAFSASGGDGIVCIGSQTTGCGFKASTTATNGQGMSLTGSGTGNGFFAQGGAGSNGDGMHVVGGAGASVGFRCIGGGTSGEGIRATSTSGPAVSFAATSGEGFTVTAGGTNFNGFSSTGIGTGKGGLFQGGNGTGGDGLHCMSGTGASSGLHVMSSGTGDGFLCQAGTGGVDIRGNRTGNLTGTVDTVTTAVNLTNAATAGDLTATMKTSVENTVWDAVMVNHNVGGSFSMGNGALRTGTAQAGSTASTLVLDASASSVDNFYNGATVRITGGTGAGQSRTILSYVGATKTATMSENWATTPDATSVFVLLAGGAPKITAAGAGAVWDVTLASHLSAGSTGLALNSAGAAGDPWNTALPGVYAAGTAGNIIGNRLDVAVSTRSTYAGADTSGTTTLLSRIPGTVQPQTGDSYARLGAPAGASVSADVAAVKVDTGGLRTDYTTVRAAKLDNLDVAVSTRSTYAGADTAGTTTLLGRIPGTVQPQTGDSFARLGAPVGVSTSADIAAVQTTANAINAKTTNLPASPAAVGSQMDLVNVLNPTAVAAIQSGLATSASQAAIAALIAALPTATQNANGLLDLADAIETGWTFRQACRILLASGAGDVAGAATATVTIKNVTGAKVRITAPVDTNGNRTGVTYDKV